MPQRSLDLRLLPLAAGVWLGSLCGPQLVGAGGFGVLGLLHGSRVYIAATVVLALAAAGFVVVAARRATYRTATVRSRTGTTRPSTTRPGMTRTDRTQALAAPASASRASPYASGWSSSVRFPKTLLALCGVIAGLSTSGLHASSVAPGLLVAAAQEHRIAEVVLTCNSPPIRAESRFGGSEVRVSVGISRIRLGAREFSLSLPATAVATGAESESLGACRPGVRMQAVVLVSQGQPRASSWGSAIVLRPRRVIGMWAAPALPAAVDAVRMAFSAAAGVLEPDRRALVAGLAIGDDSELPDDLRTAMGQAGLSHLTAVSGSNTAMVIASVLALGGLLRIRLYVRLAGAAVVLLLYVLLVGPEPSVLRAAGMGVIALLALTTGTRRAALPALLATIAVLLLAVPSLAGAAGFALSVAATAGLLVAAKPLRAWADRIPGFSTVPEPLAAALVVSAAAHVATAPLVAAIGGGVSLIAIVANIMVEPVVEPLTLAGLTAAVLAVPLPAVSSAIVEVCGPLAGYIGWVARTSVSLPGAWIAWPSGTVGALALVATGVVAWWVQRTLRSWVGPVPRVLGAGLGATVTVLASVLVIRPPGTAGWPPPGWVTVTCDVGQGDGMVIRVPGTEHAGLVLDVGPREGIDPCLKTLGITEIPIVFLTHFHADHVDGLAAALGGRRVGRILTTGLAEPPEQKAGVLRDAGSLGIGIESLKAGGQGELNGLRWRVLWPPDDSPRTDDGESAPNNASLVILFEVPVPSRSAPVRFLATGDIEPAAQRSLIASVPSPRADIAKVPHHGSRHQDQGLPDWSGAEAAMISVGEGNDYGHPARVTIDAWSAVAAVHRTDTEGDVAVVVDQEGQLGTVSRRSSR